MNDTSARVSNHTRIKESLPQPPRYDRWPVALRSAMQLRGALVECGPGVRGVAWPDSPGVRLASLRPWLSEELIAAHLTAAWVWGAAERPGSPLRIAAVAGQRTRRIVPTEMRRIEQRFTSTDTVFFGALQVTSPLRTTIDLLHDPQTFSCIEIAACHLLIPRLPDGVSGLAMHLTKHRRPHVRLARARLGAMMGNT